MLLVHLKTTHVNSERSITIIVDVPTLLPFAFSSRMKKRKLRANKNHMPVERYVLLARVAVLYVVEAKL